MRPSEAAPFLEATEIVDWTHPSVRAKGAELAVGQANAMELARSCFEWVRDNIQHSVDFRRNPITCSASEVLHHGTGYCYAKSHLLAALLRSNGIPAGLCYQRMSMDDAGDRFCLHGLNAVLLPEHGWYRMDARGNKSGVDAQFCPPVERLAFSLTLPGERDYSEVLTAPLAVVVEALRRFRSWDEMARNLPDCTSITLGSEALA
jgi:transglutaminase-like putative cysteine protease